MAELPKFGQLGPRIPFKCKEGNMTIQKINTVGGDIPGPVFQSPITDKMWVKLAGDWLIEPCAATDPECIGQVVGTPKFQGQQPTVAANWGSYEPRRVDVELMGTAVRTVTLEALNTAISVGNCVKFGGTTAQTYDKATVENGTRALVAALQHTGAKIPVLFGFYGLLTRT